MVIYYYVNLLIMVILLVDWHTWEIPVGGPGDLYFSDVIYHNIYTAQRKAHKLLNA